MALTRQQQIILGGGALAALAAVIYSRSQPWTTVDKIRAEVGKVATEAQLNAIKALIPDRSDELVDAAFAVGARYGISPFLILGFIYVEGSFRVAPSATGDRIPRLAGRCVLGSKGNCQKTLDDFMYEHPLPGAVREERTWTDGRGRTISGMAWVPTTRGWGHGFMQIDWVSHYKFLENEDWQNPFVQLDYAIKKIIKPALDWYKRNLPNASALEVFKWASAEYNAGPRIRANAKAGDQPEDMTYSPNYVSKVESFAQKAAQAVGADLYATIA